MKSIHYDAEGDILTVTFTEVAEQKHTGIELSDNIVLYYNPETEQPIKLIMVSYQAMLQASAGTPILLEGLALAPAKVQDTVTALLQRAPLTTFMQFVETHANTPPASRLQAIFIPAALQSVAAA